MTNVPDKPKALPERRDHARAPCPDRHQLERRSPRPHGEARLLLLLLLRNDGRRRKVHRRRSKAEASIPAAAAATTATAAAATTSSPPCSIRRRRRVKPAPRAPVTVGALLLRSGRGSGSLRGRRGGEREARRRLVRLIFHCRCLFCSSSCWCVGFFLLFRSF